MKYDDIEVHAKTDNVSRQEPYLKSSVLGGQFWSKTTSVELWGIQTAFYARHLMQKKTNKKKQSRADG